MAKNEFIKTDLSYDDVPWYRKRWFMVVSALIFMPATIGIALTGEVYAKRNDGVYRYSQKQRNTMAMVLALLMALNIFRMVMVG
jgi:hypothetical protein